MKTINAELLLDRLDLMIDDLIDKTNKYAKEKDLNNVIKTNGKMEGICEAMRLIKEMANDR